SLNVGPGRRPLAYFVTRPDGFGLPALTDLANPRSGVGERRHLHARVGEACASTDVGQRVGHERGARRVVARAPAPDALEQAHCSGADWRRHRERGVELTAIV